MTFKYTFLMSLFFVISFITGGVSASFTCSDLKTECVELGGTRYFEGHPVTLNCWREIVTYACRVDLDNVCQQLRRNAQDEALEYPIEQCDKAEDIDCAENTFLDSDFDFDKVASSLVIFTANKEIGLQNVENPQIFYGKPMECSINILPSLTKDCCAGNEDILGSCDAEEKELLQIKKDGRAIEVGEYCYNREPIFNTCTSYHKAHCVFDSRIARIVQNDGRKNQLGISLGHVGGDSAHLNCRGITKEELAMMDFDEMDFSSLPSDMSDIYDICDEEVKSIQRRICTKVPHIAITDDPRPGCQKHISPSGIEDCLVSYIQIPHYYGDGHGKISVPKNRGSRVAFNNSKHGYCYITILNEATGQYVVSPRTRVNNNMYIELPFSKNQDQTFSFIVHRSDGCSCNKPGRLNVYVNYLRKIPKVEWEEKSCLNI